MATLAKRNTGVGATLLDVVSVGWTGLIAHRARQHLYDAQVLTFFVVELAVHLLCTPTFLPT